MSAQKNENASLDDGNLVIEFVGLHGDYYAHAFAKIQSGAARFVFNPMAALLGPLWSGARGLWGFFWWTLFLETFALVQFGRGLWGDLGSAQMERARRLAEKSKEMLGKAQEAAAVGSDNAENLTRNAANLQRASDKAEQAAQVANTGSLSLVIFGTAAFVLLRLAQGFFGE